LTTRELTIALHLSASEKKLSRLDGAHAFFLRYQAEETFFSKHDPLERVMIYR